jgi:trimeric autotransporter adhesin
MSTKTLRKRIALVAVTALGTGLLSVVAVPSANANTTLVVTAPAASRATVATAIELLGSTVGGVPITQAAARLAKIMPGTLVQPSGSTYFVENAVIDGSADDGGTWPNLTDMRLAITPTTPGTHSFTIYIDSDADGVVDATEARGSTSFVVGGVATQLILSQSAVSVTRGQKVTMTLTALDASNRRTLLNSGASTVAGTSGELLNSATAAILVGVNASAVAEAIPAALGGHSGNSVVTASILKQDASAADVAGEMEVTALPTGITNVFGEAGTYDGTDGSQDAAGTYIPSLGAYTFAVNTAGSSSTITVTARVGTTNGSGVYTNVVTATSDATITIAAALTTPVAGVSLGIASSQTGVSSTTAAATLGATTTTTVVNNITANVTQPTVNFTLSLASGTGTYGVYVMPNASNATAGSNNGSISANATKTIPSGELDGRFQRVTLSDGLGTFAITNPTPAAAESYTVFVLSNAVVPTNSTGNVFVSMTVTYAASATSTANSSVNPPAATVKFGDPITLTVKVRDQFDVGIANRVISYTVAGRNPITTAVQATTNAAGDATFTLADTAATTAAGTSTVTVELNPLVAAGSTETAILTYNAVGSVVGSVTLTDNQASDAVIEYDANPTNGTSQVTYTATVLDANGIGLAGVPVTLSVPTGVTVFALDAASGTTDAAGQFTVRVSSNLIGTYSFTATSGGRTSSATTQKWTQGAVNATGAPSEARRLVLSSSTATTKAEGIIQMTARVTDLYGNPVANVQVTLTENGVGRFLVQSGSNSSVTAFTDTNGVVTADITSTGAEAGTNRVEAAFTGSFSNAGTATAITSPQYLDLAGFVGSTPVAGAFAGNESANATVEFGGGTATVSNAEVLRAIVSLIASINKQISALQKALLRR